jgi:hypothetical protein
MKSCAANWTLSRLVSMAKARVARVYWPASWVSGSRTSSWWGIRAGDVDEPFGCCLPQERAFAAHDAR